MVDIWHGRRIQRLQTKIEMFNKWRVPRSRASCAPRGGGVDVAQSRNKGATVRKAAKRRDRVRRRRINETKKWEGEKKGGERDGEEVGRQGI